MYEVVIREWDFTQGIPVLTNQDRATFNSRDVVNAYIKTLIMEHEHKGFSCRKNRVDEEWVWVCDSPTKKVIIRVRGWL